VVEPLYQHYSNALLSQHTGIGLKGTPMTLLLVMIVEISVAMAVGFILGRIWQMRNDLEQKLEARFAVPDENG
jgi:hypothetical protein